jgi:hypothetical protein
VAAGYELEAAVFRGAILQRDPNTDHSQRLCVQIAAVLVRIDLAANERLLEDVHALAHHWLFEAEGLEHTACGLVKRDAFECGIECVESVRDFVEHFFGFGGLVLVVSEYLTCLLLQERPNFVTAC